MAVVPELRARPAEARRVPVLVPLDGDGRIDLERVRAAVTARTRLLFVATPNNPTGRRSRRRS